MLEPRIIPAIIPRSALHLRKAIARLKDIASEIQIDIVDDVFVPEMLETALSYELDFMIAHPFETLPVWLAQHPRSVVLHIESFATDADVVRAIRLVRAEKSNAVVATLNDTPLKRLLSLVPYCDGVQCMGIAEIGTQGNPFDTRVLARIQTIRNEHPELSISVDGSVNKDTILALKSAGANRFVVGSAIFDSDDPVRAYAELCVLVET